MDNYRYAILDSVIYGSQDELVAGKGEIESFPKPPLADFIPAIAFLRILAGTLDDLSFSVEVMEIDWVKKSQFGSIYPRLHLKFSETTCSNGVGAFGTPTGLSFEIWSINNHPISDFSFEKYIRDFAEGIEKEILRIDAGSGKLERMAKTIRLDLIGRESTLHRECIEMNPYNKQLEQILGYK